MDQIITLKRILPTDVLDLQHIGKATFTETFAWCNTEENMLFYLASSFNAEQLLTQINHPDSEFYFAVSGTEILGYLKVNLAGAQTELQDTMGLEIERIYVLKAFQGKKVGQILFDKAVQIAQSYDKTYLWLGVWEENTKAIAFYKRNGFVVFDTHDFKLGNEVQTDFLMKKQI
jgi:diamine N-acetyltransferase